nr:putative reverse transcriptase domain-containing protein [Tanacetum cinerariifolium]
ITNDIRNGAGPSGGGSGDAIPHGIHVWIKRGCFTCGPTQHKEKDCPQGKEKDCPQGKQKQSMSTDLARLPPTTGRVYATTRGQAAKTSGAQEGWNVEHGKHTEFSVDDDGVVWFEDMLCVPSNQALHEKVMTEAHSSPFTMHPGNR